MTGPFTRSFVCHKRSLDRNIMSVLSASKSALPICCAARQHEGIRNQEIGDCILLDILGKARHHHLGGYSRRLEALVT